MIEEKGLLLGTDLESELVEAFQTLKTAPNWSNGRDIRTLLEFVLRAEALRLADKTTDALDVLTRDDLISGMKALLNNKMAGANS